MVMINDYFKRLGVDKEIIEAKKCYYFNQLYKIKKQYKCLCYAYDNNDIKLIKYLHKIHDYFNKTKTKIDKLLKTTLKYSFTNAVLWILDIYTIVSKKN